MLAGAVGWVLMSSACNRPEPVLYGQDYELGEVQECADSSVEGFDRFTERAADFGLDLVIEGQYEPGPCGYIPGNVVAQDIDDDGDTDLLYNLRTEAPALYLNDGRGDLTRTDGVLPGL